MTIPVSPRTQARRIEITHAPGGSRTISGSTVEQVRRPGRRGRRLDIRPVRPAPACHGIRAGAPGGGGDDGEGARWLSAGLGLSIVSYAGQLLVGLASDAHLLPDHDRLLALLDDEIGALQTTAASSSQPEPGAATRRRGAEVTSRASESPGACSL